MENPGACTSLLACPVCAGPLADSGRSARCRHGHSFDYARSGYLNLTVGGGRRGRIGDSAEMVRARAEFLAAGHFQPLATALAGAGDEALAELAREGDGAPGALVEVGCGTGYYLGAVADALREQGRPARCAIGLDLSKAAIDRAARSQPRARFVVADVEAGIPLMDGAAALALSAFAPRPAAELARVVRPGGALLVLYAEPGHLRGLCEKLGLLGVGEDKLERLGERLAPWFALATEIPVRYELELPAADARRLVLMGPNARHGHDPAAITGPQADLVSVTVARFRRRLE